MDRILRVLRGGLRITLALTLAAAVAGKLSAAEAAASPGPELTGPAQVLEHLPAADSRANESLVEMPIAEAEELVAQPPPAVQNRPEQPRAAVPQTQASPLPTADRGEDRSVQLEQVAQQADRRTRHGCELAGRGAYFAARAEFVGALRLMAAGLDSESKATASTAAATALPTNVHCRALATALTAMKEAEDFLPGGSRLEADLDLPAIVAAHATPVLKDNTKKMTPLTALRCYHTFAQEQFAAAAGREMAGSMALHALGKLHAALAQKKAVPIVAPESKAMVFYQAALLVYPKNHMAANDLGVLLAQCGRYSDARTMLQRSVALCPQSTGWRNLSVVYRQLGQAALAQQAAGQSEQFRRSELARRRTSPAAGNGLVQWVDPQAFAQSSTNTHNAPGAVAMPPARTAELPAAPGRLPTAVANRAAPPLRPTAGMNWPTPAPRPAPDEYGPAPTPAAAQRSAWGAPGYQR